MTRCVLAHAPAKINLTLDVVGRRSDGYHDVVSVMQAIALWDELVFELRPAGISVVVDGALLGEDNLVRVAAERLGSLAGGRGAHIRLRKRIPLAAGLGGGSSDAAATLRGLDALWELALGPDALQEHAAALGSDVPFFLAGGRALATGRGEQLAPLAFTPGHVIVVTPPIARADKTRSAYGALLPGDWSQGPAMTGNWDGRCHNVFDRVAPVLYPALVEALPELGSAACDWCLAGAGPSVFRLGSDHDEPALPPGMAGWPWLRAQFEPAGVRLEVSH